VAAVSVAAAHQVAGSLIFLPKMSD